MTTDERLDKLAERHQALAESLEVMRLQWEDRWSDVADALEKTAEANAETAEANRRTETALRRAIEFSTREARNERQRRHAAFGDLTQLVAQIAAAQLATEQKLQRFLESRTGHNGDS